MTFPPPHEGPPPRHLDEEEQMHRHFAQEIVSAGGGTTSWLNHWSLMHANWAALSAMDRVGFDGTFLQLALYRAGHHVHRTSADLVLPHVLHDLLPEGSRIVVVGAAPGVAQQASKRMGPHDIRSFDGYGQLREIRAHPQEIIDFAPRLILVGLGAGLQEEVAAELHAACPQAMVCTVGGWIDQLARSEHYFPRWVHKLRLGWAWRILHEPRRVLRRYTIDALRFSRKSRSLIAKVEALGPWDEYAVYPKKPSDTNAQ
ncbi:WecB/TagA/CpsF family glycosyltransferase [Schaalia sp. Marseille-Q2122]|uniref:WecB/TagA/CpsF family glycosyltransferase n=1 Tax=Schaalia sp. Marseille-Q2122 TaxID=2736604 RepID=UPI00158D7C70|nr:WecB/TagA/CpsF family glycosyltransferase [Schaalia sp. Marseille-Q2122]